ncbi:hypothetical protein MUK42_11431 [Musa troglodytarum]|uniref:Uncharacterized protein n=1 Tax=Musa troglodytarum TaxID=320322 RepID=A0A9E7GPL0_9LILI|nr:hypothetical protein MUK42_11431 [Musa troglodytarum]
MASPRFLSLFLVTALVSLSFCEGHGRKLIMRGLLSETENGLWTRRDMEEMVMDYKEPGANTNPRSGVFFGTPPSPPRP